MAEGARFSPASPLPVAWTPERERRGAAPDRGTYRCPERGCPVVSASLRAMVAHVRAHREADLLPDVSAPGGARCPAGRQP